MAASFRWTCSSTVRNSPSALQQSSTSYSGRTPSLCEYSTPTVLARASAPRNLVPARSSSCRSSELYGYCTITSTVPCYLKVRISRTVLVVLVHRVLYSYVLVCTRTSVYVCIYVCIDYIRTSTLCQYASTNQPWRVARERPQGRGAWRNWTHFCFTQSTGGIT